MFSTKGWDNIAAGKFNDTAVRWSYFIYSLPLLIVESFKLLEVTIGER